MDEHMYQVAVEDLTVPSSIFVTIEPAHSVSGAIVQIAQKKTSGEPIEWERIKSLYDEPDAVRTVYPGWRRDRVVLILCVLIAGFLIGLGVGKRTHSASESQPTPAPAPVVSAQPATYPRV